MRQHFPCEEGCYDVNFAIGKLGSLVTGMDSTTPVCPLHALPALVSYAFASYMLVLALPTHFGARLFVFIPGELFSCPLTRFHAC